MGEKPMSPGHKKSIWAGEPIDRLLSTRKGDNKSGAINAAVDRYLEVCKRHTPKLSVGEWCAIFDALNGTWMLDAWSPTYIFAEVHDTEGLGDKWGIDQAELVAKLQGMSYAESVAIADATERFWASDLQPGEDGWKAPVVAIVGEKAVEERK